MACATFGLILGGIIAGPVAGRLIRLHKLKPATGVTSSEDSSENDEHPPIDGNSLLWTLFALLACLIGGQFIAGILAGAAFTLPGFIWCLMIGVLIRNAEHFIPRLALHHPTVDMQGSISLFVFLSMALMSLQLWELLSLAGRC